MTRQFADVSTLVDQLIVDTKGRVVMALPLGLGKANHIANELYRRAEQDSSLSLHIVTALTLEAPVASNELEKRFLDPLRERFWSHYPSLRYADARRRGELPDNIVVEEFFFQAGTMKNNPQAQQHHICANYTHALRFVMQRGINVLAQLLSEPVDTASGCQVSCSCNPDFTADLLAARRAGELDFVFAGQVNRQLPYLPGDAEIDLSEIDCLVNESEYDFPLFAVPKTPLTNADHAMGLHVASVIEDGGTLQIGIGSLGDAVAQGLVLRHHHNALYRQTMAGFSAQFESPVELLPFEEGLHGVSEMLVDVFFDLMDRGILTRCVDGKVLHGAFYVGDQRFYQRLRYLPDPIKDSINLCSVLFANELYGDEALKRQQRVKARFVNKAMMVTALGEVVSDGLEEGAVISGVGGQYNFVSQAFALPDARSIIVVPATRSQRGQVQSNIVWKYANTTIPRHLRDMVVTEYGVADLRGKNDADVIAELINIADSRFQQQLLQQAVAAGKLPKHYQIPDAHRHNTPQALADRLASMMSLLSAFPFGSDFDADDLLVMPVLQRIRAVAHSKWAMAQMVIKGFGMRELDSEQQTVLKRLALLSPRSLKETALRSLVLGATLAANTT